MVHNQNMQGMVNPHNLAGILKSKSLYDAAMKTYGHQTYFDYEAHHQGGFAAGLAANVDGDMQGIINDIPGGKEFEKCPSWAMPDQFSAITPLLGPKA